MSFFVFFNLFLILQADQKNGDSDDEISELRIQALLTKRVNEAEVSPTRDQREYQHTNTQQYNYQENYRTNVSDNKFAFPINLRLFQPFILRRTVKTFNSFSFLLFHLIYYFFNLLISNTFFFI